MWEQALLKEPWYLPHLTSVWQFISSKHEILSPLTQTVHGAIFLQNNFFTARWMLLKIELIFS